MVALHSLQHAFYSESASDMQPWRPRGLESEIAFFRWGVLVAFRFEIRDYLMVFIRIVLFLLGRWSA